MELKDVIRLRLIELREAREWTQAEVASRLNISQRAYSHYENGSRNISIEMLVDIANIYEVSVDYLLKSIPGGVVKRVLAEAALLHDEED